MRQSGRMRKIINSMGYSLSAAIWVIPSVVLFTVAGQQGGQRGLALAGLLAYPVLFLACGPAVERLRARWLLRERIPAGRARVASAVLYGLVNLLLSVVEVGAVVGWALVVARNVFWYPIF